jgi:hypothetical protein
VVISLQTERVKLDESHLSIPQYLEETDFTFFRGMILQSQNEVETVIDHAGAIPAPHEPPGERKSTLSAILFFPQRRSLKFKKFS